MSVTSPFPSNQHNVRASSGRSTTKEGTPEYSENLSQMVEMVEGLCVHVAVFQGGWRTSA